MTGISSIIDVRTVNPNDVEMYDVNESSARDLGVVQ